VTLAGTASEIELGAELGGGTLRLSTRAIGEIFLENALAACVTCLALGAEREVLLGRLAQASPPPGRFEIVGREPTVVVDYAHTPDALERTVATARALTNGRVTIVFGAGGHRDPAKRPAMGAAVARAARAILTSDNPRDEAPELIAHAIRDGIPPNVEVILELEREQAIRRAILDAAAADVVVVAGKGHESTQTVGSIARAFSDAGVARSVLAERARGHS
jgi:UDP-N-acetylmuramoyl-L-alanyl-D-glutamate--2,6-diaminopimelate ligase